MGMLVVTVMVMLVMEKPLLVQATLVVVVKVTVLVSMV